MEPLTWRVTGTLIASPFGRFKSRMISVVGAEIYVFFFFQAEDGIRDLIVTGVQTCALPICGIGGASQPLHFTLAYGGGFEVQRLASTTNPTSGQIEAAPRGILEISKLNLTGRADTLSFKLRGSTLQGRALLGYSDPNTFANPHLSFQATAFAEKTRDINTFTEQRNEGSVQLTDQASALTTVLLRYAFRQVRVSDLKILSQEIPL